MIKFNFNELPHKKSVSLKVYGIGNLTFILVILKNKMINPRSRIGVRLVVKLKHRKWDSVDGEKTNASPTTHI